jgi:hypothetical protein
MMLQQQERAGGDETAVMRLTRVTRTTFAAARRRAVEGAPENLQSGYTCLACVLGVGGFGLTMLSSEQALCATEAEVKVTQTSGGGGADNPGLVRWPSTVSELGSDFSTGRGRLFLAFMLITGALLLSAQVPYQVDIVPGDARRRRCCCGLANARTLQHARQVTAPIGLAFVALCPTSNYWTRTSDPGANVTQDVHLFAAALLFLGGTICEVLRLLHIAQGQVVLTPCCRGGGGGGGGGPLPARRRQPGWWSRRLRCYSWGLWARQPAMRPRVALIWMMFVGTLGAVGSLMETHGVFAGSAFWTRRTVLPGTVVLSPVGTSYCPYLESRQSYFKYANISTAEQCARAMAQLAMVPEACPAELDAKACRHHLQQGASGGSRALSM